MRKDLLAATALGSATFLTAWSGTVMAAPAPVYNWSGTYFGAAIGANSQAPANFNYPSGGDPGTITFTDNTPYFPFETSADDFPAFPSSMQAPRGVPSIYLGTNWQSGHAVYGWESDLSFLGTSLSTDVGADDFLTTFPFGRSGEFTASGGLNALFTFRPRVGVAIDKLLLYGTGGLAVGQASLTTGAHLEDFAKGVGPEANGTADWSGSTSAWKTGFVVGGGGEYEVNKRMSVRFEALYYNLGSISVTATGSGSDNVTTPSPYSATSYTGTMPLSGTIARVGLTFHID